MWPGRRRDSGEEVAGQRSEPGGGGNSRLVVECESSPKSSGGGGKSDGGGGNSKSANVGSLVRRSPRRGCKRGLSLDTTGDCGGNPPWVELLRIIEADSLSS